MRVVAGSAGGISLHTPRTDIRPTMDRVKAAIFSSLGDAVIGARVLDLFAGSGALGIEALSRGAASATFVDKDAAAVEAIRRNLEKTRLAAAAADVRGADVFAFLERAAAAAAYDIVFADPPYAKRAGERDFAAELLASSALARALAPEGLFILEKMPAQALAWPPPWELLRAKRYGATEVAILRVVSPSSAAE